MERFRLCLSVSMAMNDEALMNEGDTMEDFMKEVTQGNVKFEGLEVTVIDERTGEILDTGIDWQALMDSLLVGDEEA